MAPRRKTVSDEPNGKMLRKVLSLTEKVEVLDKLGRSESVFISFIFWFWSCRTIYKRNTLTDYKGKDLRGYGNREGSSKGTHTGI